jgi:hypothetical protein
LQNTREQQEYQAATPLIGHAHWGFLTEFSVILARRNPAATVPLRYNRNITTPFPKDDNSFIQARVGDVDAIAPQIDGKFMSAFVRAVKPASAGAKACCGQTCCN